MLLQQLPWSRKLCCGTVWEQSIAANGQALARIHVPEQPGKPVNHEILQTEICLGRGESDFQQIAFVSKAPVPVPACQRVMPGYMCLVGLK